MCELVKPSFVSFEDNTFVIHHFPYIVDFRSAMWVAIRTLIGCKYRHALRANVFGRACFFSFGALSGLVRTASALCRLLICCSAPKMHISHSIAAAQLPPSRRDATTLEINTRSIDCTFGQMTKYPQQNPVFRPK
jgi:hypothetical protein